MEQNNSDDNEKIYSDLRKEATYRTALKNRATFEKMDWSIVENENNLAKAGMLVNANLPVIKSEDSLIPVWDLKGYDFLFNNCIPFGSN